MSDQKQQMTTASGRQTNKVNYNQKESHSMLNNLPKQPTKSKSKDWKYFNLANEYDSMIVEAINAGMPVSIDDGSQLLLKLQGIARKNHQFQIKAVFIDSNNNEFSAWAFAHDQPSQLLITILSSARDESESDNLANQLYKKLTQTIGIDPDSGYLKYKETDLIIYKSYQEYDINAQPIWEMKEQEGHIISIHSHDALGDFSKEYTIELDNRPGQYITCHEAFLRKRGFVASEQDWFNTTLSGLYVYEAQRALELKKFDYIDDTGLMELPRHLDIYSAYFNNFKQYFLYGTREWDDQTKLLLKNMIQSKITLIISNSLKSLKAGDNGVAKAVKYHNHIDSAKYGASFECIEIDYILDMLIKDDNEQANDNNNDYPTIDHTKCFIKISFENMIQINKIASIGDNDLTYELKQGTKLKMLLDKKIIFRFKRDTRLLSLYEFEYNTTIP